MAHQPDSRLATASLRALFRAPKIQTLLVIIPSAEAKDPAEWRDKQGRQWLRALPSSTAPGLAVFFSQLGWISPGSFSWPAVLQRGKDFLAALSELIENEKLQHCPILLASHSAGGLVVKEALRRTHQDPYQYRQLLQTLAGVILLGTPHSTSEDRKSWQNSIDQKELEDFAKFSLEFEKANILTPVLSIYETQPSRVKSSIMSIMPNKKIHLTSKELVTTNARQEELLALDSQHKELCNIDTASNGYAAVVNFMTAVLEDTRLRIVKGSPEYKAASALDNWTTDEGNEYLVLRSEGEHSDLIITRFSLTSDPQDPGFSGSEPNSTSRSDPCTKVATAGSSDAGFEMIPQSSEITSGRLGARLPCHILPVSRNKGFFGRVDALQEISNSFFPSTQAENNLPEQEPNEVKTFALCGPGGIGKTQTAIEFVFTHKDRYDAIFWIFADATAKISESFSRIALELGLVTADSVDARDPVVTRDLVKGWLANPLKKADPADDGATDHASWLLVFDNADLPEELEEYWPLDGPGCVLFTSRDPLAKHSNYLATNGVDMRPFGIDEGKIFLTKLTMKEEDGGNVVEVLGGFPLALTQMAGVIVRRDLTFDEFVKTYNEDNSREELLQLRLSRGKRRSGYEHTVASVWALESLRHGRTLLNVLSFLDADRIQEAILTTHPEVLSLEHFPKTSISYQRARTELSQSSLIGRNAETIQVHRLIQDAARTKIGLLETKATFSATVELVSSVWPFAGFDWRHGATRWHVCDQLFPHVLTLKQHYVRLNLSCDTFEVDLQFAKLLTDAGWYVHECGRSADSPPFFVEARNIVDRLKASFLQGHRTDQEEEKQLNSLLAEIHHNLGCVGTETNEPKETLAHFTKFNELMMQEIGDGAQGKDKRLAISWNELGNAYMLNGMWDKGEESFERSIGTMQRVDDFKWTDVSFPLVNLGWAYLLTDRLEEANEILMEGLAHREFILGVDDKDSFITGRFLHALGNVKAAQDVREESLAYHERALSQYLSTIGKNHHRTGDVYVKLAEHQHFLRQPDKALRYLDLALRIFAPRANLKPEKARALYKRSLVLEGLNRLDDSSLDRRESVRLYGEIVDGSARKERLHALVEKDFDDLVAFWSR